MPAFNLQKGSKFQLDKGIRRVHAGLGWDAKDGFDLDACAFGLVHITGDVARFYNDGSHAAFYGNTGIKRPDGRFVTDDGSMTHFGDNRVGAASGDAEVIEIDFTKLPAEIVEVAFWVTIYDAKKKHQTFGGVHSSYIRITDADSNSALCEYKLRDEFANAMAIQVGSFVKNDTGNWEFQAVGAGANVEIGQVIDQYS